jgi:hypothetical protein
MKFYATLIGVLLVNLCLAQIETPAWDGIDKLGNVFDRANSKGAFKIKNIGYDEIPKYLEFRGGVVNAVQWKDAMVENILIQTVTGVFGWKNYYDDTEFEVEAKQEIFAYLFIKPHGEKKFKLGWRVYDFVTCWGVDMDAQFIPYATTITDLDNDGISEIAMPYENSCRGDISPGTMKIIMYEGNTKYALRGETQMLCSQMGRYDSNYEPSENLVNKESFLSFLTRRWKMFECEDSRPQ